MEKKIIDSLSPDFIIHPGETIKELLADREMTQKELAFRANASEKFVSELLSGKRNISETFARKLENVFGIETSFWVSLQDNYDKEITDFKYAQNISLNR